jgi:polar amino acid transport system substrate-binding protein
MTNDFQKVGLGASYPRACAIVASIGVFALAVLSAGCGADDSGVRGETAYERALRTGVLRVAYITYPPSFVRDPNTGRFSGIFHELLQEGARSLGLRVQYSEEVAWGTMIEAVASGRVDLVCTGLWPTAARARRAEFSRAIYYSPIRAYARAGDRRFDGRLASANARSVRIATIDGEMSSIIAQSDYPGATAQSLPQNTQISQLLLEVASGKADLTFVEVAVAEEYMRRNPGTIAPVRGVDPVRVFPNVLMVGKGEFELLSMLNAAIEELESNGITERVIARYETIPGSLLRPRPPYLLPANAATR